MAKESRKRIKTYFQTGDQPTENEFINVFDSTLNLSGSNAITGSLIISGSTSDNADGSAPNLHVMGNITASGNILALGDVIARNYIVSSSVTNITTQTLSGSTEFGNSTDDTHQFTGHITASGHISASLDIFGRGLRLYGPDSIISNGDSIFGNNASLDTHKFSGSVNIVGDVTSSGNISASGNLIVNEITASGNISASGNLYVTGNVGIGTNPADRKFHVDTGNSTVTSVFESSYVKGVLLDISSSAAGVGDSAAIRFLSHEQNYTVGAASGSFHIANANNILSETSDSQKKLTITGSTGYVGIGTTSPTEALTVQGNISASGDIIGSELNIISSNLNGGTRMNRITYDTGHSGSMVLGDEHATLDLYNPLEANTLEKGSVLTFSDNFSGSGAGGYVQTTRAAIKGGTSKIGNYANGFLAFYTDKSAANTMLEAMRIDEDGRLKIGTSGSSAALLTVAGDISSSGNIIAQHITASGNISASGTITAQNINMDTDQFFRAGGVAVIKYDSTEGGGRIEIGSANEPLAFINNITASGNISSSGYIVADYYVTNISEPVVAGVNLASATPIDPSSGTVISQGSDGVAGLKLPEAQSIPRGTTYRIINKSTGRAIKLYPFDASDQIYPLTAGTSASIGVLESMTLTSDGGEIWYGSKGTGITG